MHRQAVSRPWVLCLSLVACGTPILASDTREAVSVTVGEEFTVSLESNPSTGYSWTLVTPDPFPAGLQLVSHAATPGRSGVAGAAGTDDWTFKARATGNTTLTFEYRRSWDKVSAKTHTVRVTAEIPVTGQYIGVDVGEGFTIDLESNPTTGYGWTLTAPDPLARRLQLVGHGYSASRPGVIGGAGLEDWNFKATAKGSTTLIFEYMRSWERVALRRHIVQVVAHERRGVIHVAKGLGPSRLLQDGSPEHPYDTIQKAISAAAEGTVIEVAPGTYPEAINLMGKAIEINGIQSGDPNAMAWPVIDGQTQATTVWCTPGDSGDCVLTGLVITGGKGRLAGGILCIGNSLSVINCLIVGNRATDPNGGAVYCQDSNAVFVNCTIADNYGGSNGAGLLFKDGLGLVANSILWANGPSQAMASGTIHTVINYTDVAGGWSGAGNLKADPLFASSGFWATPGDLAKAASLSDPNAIWVPGDYHLKSRAGRWDPRVQAWVLDAATSPAIDQGDPLSAVGSEPVPNGNRINLGAYGGTRQASRSSP